MSSLINLDPSIWVPSLVKGSSSLSMANDDPLCWPNTTSLGDCRPRDEDEENISASLLNFLSREVSDSLPREREDAEMSGTVEVDESWWPRERC